MARSFDIFGTTDGVSLFPPTVVTSTVNGAAVDARDLAGQARCILEIANISGTPTFDVIVEEASDSGFTTDVGTVITFTQITADELQQLRLNVNGAQQFLRLVITVGGGSPSGVVAAYLVASRHRLPTG